MHIPRIYHPLLLSPYSKVLLNSNAARHVSRVLRMSVGQTLHLFDGSNQVFTANIIYIDQKNVSVQLEAAKVEDRESPLKLHLGQVISRGEKMEFTIQKSIELGVNIITPLFSQRCGVKLNKKRLEKKNSSGKILLLLLANNVVVIPLLKFVLPCYFLIGANKKVTVQS